jgi:hypothetical protein
MARELGMTVSELQDRMTSAELTEWIALYQIEKSERDQQRQLADQRARRKR